VLRWRRCTMTIDTPPRISSRPTPISQRRSKPVNGSVVAFSLAGAVVLVGAVSLAVVAGFYSCLDGATPLDGVVVAEVVGVCV
jgi:hypothetical protein